MQIFNRSVSAEWDEGCQQNAKDGLKTEGMSPVVVLESTNRNLLVCKPVKRGQAEIKSMQFKATVSLCFRNPEIKLSIW